MTDPLPVQPLPTPTTPPLTSASTPSAPRRSTMLQWLAIVVLLVLLGVSVIANVGLALAAVAGLAVSRADSNSSTARYAEETLRGSGRTKVVKIEVTGIITLQGENSLFFEQEGAATRALKEIRAARKDDNVLAILLLVDSPGGGVTASDLIYEELLRFRDSRKDRKIVALMRDIAASGGYYISAGADKIVAHRTTITGSIGVLISSLNLKGLGDKFGVKAVTIKSGKNKDLLNPLRDPTPEETNILQTVVNDMFERFVSIVARGRALPAERVRALADGRIYTATEALEHQLIDQIGYEDDAIELLKELTHTQNFRLIRYKHTRSLYELLGAHLGAPMALPLPAHWRAEYPQVQYLWRPEL